ncbi:MAG TPA: SAM-dependent methyltransferase, partial [Candidatus Nanopelagicales bacterium]|nr:SAM-dependent methyltransferase [Candidatus Nanopelagicales bacterium]
GEKPTNPFHVAELDAEQLRDLLAAAGFAEVVVHGLHHGPRIEEWERRSGVGMVAAQIAAALAVGDDAAGPSGLAECVASVTVQDFVMGGADGSQDLVAVAVAP